MGMMSKIKPIILVGLVTISLFVLLEAGFRVIAPQDESLTCIDGGSPGIPDEELGHCNRPAVRWNETCPEYRIDYRLNTDGLRNPPVSSGKRSGDSFRILLIGDSFTFCKGVTLADSWPMVFQRTLAENRISAEVLNAGVQAYDTRQELIYLKRIFSRYQPDLVILTLMANDIWSNRLLEDNSQAEQTGSIVQARDEKPFILHSVKFFQSLLMRQDWLYSRIYLSRRRSQYFQTPFTSEVEDQLRITKELLGQADEFCRQEDTDFWVFTIPQLFQVVVTANQYNDNKLDPDGINRDLGEWCRERGINWVNALPLLSQEYRNGKPDLYYRVDGHLNPRGNRLVGRYFAEIFIGEKGSGSEY